MADGKTLFITGASSGIGAQTARQAVAAGWNVGLFARSEDKITALAKELGDAALALPGDVADRAAQAAALDKLADKFGGIDAVFANAGTGVEAPGTQNGDPDEWHDMIHANVMGVLYTAHAALPHLRKTKGHYVVTGSAAGRRHIKGSIYGATKWFVHGFAGNLAEEMTEWGGRCTVISPGMVDTEFFDEADDSRLHPSDVADAVMHALMAPGRADVREIHLMPNRNAD
ncbi:SDR family oxidoreductase [Jannaschia pohangensis]|uniref:NADP-dependent 3-hydroxy acid dehydrogenase YdfG n=1 Tax=Jannaschia pohangensis TaxID=390807 RepID=A0A1I3QEQ8_9RHOB|nr:SDR family oxidoreductase [Jannaschia pohangensis]SFJ32019.1 NADP-dependent 3-hydroxy acid dehydrogenase YdfG [Jannaschia pohangensis]